MPFLIVVVIFLAMVFIWPTFTRYFIIAPLLAFGFGGCGWAVAGFMGMGMSFGSFFAFQLIALILVVALLLKTA